MINLVDGEIKLIPLHTPEQRFDPELEPAYEHCRDLLRQHLPPDLVSEFEAALASPQAEKLLRILLEDDLLPTTERWTAVGWESLLVMLSALQVQGDPHHSWLGITEENVDGLYYLIFNSQNATSEVESLEGHQGLSASYLTAFVAHFYPQVWQEALGWEMSPVEAITHFSTMVKNGEDVNPLRLKLNAWLIENIAEDGVIPIYKEAGVGTTLAAQDNLHDLFNIPPRNRYFFKGSLMYDPPPGALVVLDNDKKSIAHERNHLQNPGLRLSKIGAALDEGMTDALAFQEVNGDAYRGISSMMAAVLRGESYWRERGLIKKITHNNPDIFKVFSHRYAYNDNLEISTAFTTYLLDEYGPEGLVALFLASSGNKAEGSPLKVKPLSTKEVAAKLRRRPKSSSPKY